MSDYSQTTFFGPKDSLPLGNPSKLILGTDVDTELANIATAVASKYDAPSIAAAPVGFSTGTVSIPAIYLGPDTTTGWYRAATNQVALSISATNALTISSTGLTVAGAVTINGAGTSLTVANNATISGTLAVSTGGSSIKGGLSVTAPSSGFALTAAGVIASTAGGGITSAAGTGIFLSGGNSAEIVQVNGLGGTDSKMWDSFADTTTLHFRAINDAGVIANDWLRVTRSGLTITNIQIPDDGGTLQTVGWRGTPINQQTGNYTLVLADRGKSVWLDGSGPEILTIPANVFSGGDVVCIVSTSSTTATIAQGSSLNLIWGNGSGATTGNRSMAPDGIATVLFLNATNAVITGSSLT